MFFTKHRAAVILGVVMGVTAPMLAMIPSSSHSEAAVAVMDQRNIEQAIRQAIQTANILTTEQKQMALMILNAKKFDPLKIALTMNHLNSVQDAVWAEIGYNKEAEQVLKVWMSQINDIKRVGRGEMTVYDVINKEVKRQEAMAKQAQKLEDRSANRLIAIKDVVDASNNAEGSDQILQAGNSSTASDGKFDITIAGADDEQKAGDSGNFNILGDFMNYYEKSIIVPGAARIVPIAFNLTIILAAIDASIKLFMDLISGDKIKFLVSTCLKVGFLLFLIHNWFGGTGLNLMGSLGEGFQSIGFAAGGAPEGKLQPNSIVNNGIAMVMSIWGPITQSFSIMSPLNSLVQLLLLIPVVILVFLTGIEIFMAQIEFYTMALITIPLIPFGAMFNLAVKLSVICFLQSAIMKIFGDYAESIAKATAADKGAVSISMLLQLLLVTLIMYFLVKKIPDLVTGLLSGNPALNGGSMMQTAKSMASNGAQAAGAVLSGGTAVAGKAVAGAVSGSKAGFKAAGSGGAFNKNGKAGAIGKMAGGMLAAGSGAIGALGGAAADGISGAGGLMKGMATSAAAKAMQPFNKGVNAVTNPQDGILAGKSKFNILETRTGGGGGGDGAGGGSGAQEARGGSQEGSTSHGNGADDERGKSAAQAIAGAFGPGGAALKDVGGALKGKLKDTKINTKIGSAMQFIPSKKAEMSQALSNHTPGIIKDFSKEFSASMKEYSNPKPPTGEGGASKVSSESKTHTEESTSKGSKE